jgi:hypothetical protein
LESSLERSPRTSVQAISKTQDMPQTKCILL